jgi:adenosylcobinamide-phosphate synthase
MEPGKLAAAYALDWCVGDPERLPHPVRMIGWSIGASERALRRHGSDKCSQLARGGLVAVGVPVLSALCVYALLRGLRNTHPTLGTAAELWLASTCLSTRNLLDEASEVIRALEKEDLCRARLRLARIVGRDTDELSEEEVCRALVPLAVAYKAVNTLDSMIGHKDENYLYFGRVAARLDDAANYLPSRIAALLLCVASGLIPQADGVRAGQIWLRDGCKHASPNAGQVEAAMAGLLGVRLGGTNTYAGEEITSAHLGNEFPRPNRDAARRACKAVGLASLLGFGAALLFALRNKHE